MRAYRRGKIVFVTFRGDVCFRLDQKTAGFDVMIIGRVKLLCSPGVEWALRRLKECVKKLTGSFLL